MSPTKRPSPSAEPSPSKRHNHTPDSAISSPALSSASEVDPFHDYEHILHSHVCIHLAKLYPDTPDDVLYFIATRMLSRDCPHGHDGPWAPFTFEDGPQLVNSALDQKVKEMYAVAYRSYMLLVMECPDHEHKL